MLSGTYEIRGVLGAGGSGQVFDAHDRALNRRVAVKVAWPGVRGLGLLLRQEAQALAVIRHPALVSVYAFGAHEGIEYLVMERVPGVTLEEHLAQRRASGEPLPIEDAYEILIAISEALAAVHRAGIAHRDVKPGNVLLAPGGRVVLSDFGLVVPEFDVDGAALLGTPAYMAPESILGTVKAGAAHLVDTYALGVLAFELVTGAPPFLGGRATLLIQHVEAAVPELPHAAPKLAALVHEMLAKDPTSRPQQVESVVWRLRALRADHLARSPLRPFSVLVVDDDPHIAKLVAMYVRAAVPKADVTVVSSGKEALAKIQEAVPHLLLLDLMMPGMTGVELHMYLRGARLAEQCTIVAMSAGASAADIALLYELGIARFILKDEKLRSAVSDIAREVRTMLPTEPPPSR